MQTKHNGLLSLFNFKQTIDKNITTQDNFYNKCDKINTVLFQY